MNNLLRDQVVRNGNPDIILAKISEAVPHARRLVLNADDPISQQLGDGRSDNVTFGMRTHFPFHRYLPAPHP